MENRYDKYKDSGIAWIGEIPEHWEVRRLKHLGKNYNGLTYSPNDICGSEDGILVLRSSNIKDNKLCFDDNVYVKKGNSSKTYCKQRRYFNMFTKWKCRINRKNCIY